MDKISTVQRSLKSDSRPLAAGVIIGGVKANIVKKAVTDGADLFEVRVDTFKGCEPSSARKSLENIKKITNLPIILTIRSMGEGGGSIPDTRRLALFEGLTALADFVDIELSSGKILKNVVESAHRQKKKVIISYHNFKSTPGDDFLEGIIRKGRNAGGDIIKIAAFAKKPEDLRRLAELLAGSSGLIVIAMGAYGAASRVFFPMIGSMITYCSLTKASAPGQMTLRDVKKELKRYGF